MCGIVVACLHDRVDLERFDAALSTLHHRGPDGMGRWVAPDGRCAVGFRRLAIVGPVHETQPFASLDGSVQVVVNGEIYNHQGLRRELVDAGARMRTASDCEVVLHGYLQHGIDFLGRLQGELAGVVWDQRTRRLHAFRDRWGVKPLFYVRCAAGLLVASEAKALFALGHAPRWSRSGLYQHLFGSLGPARTLFDGVSQVRPGEVLEWDGLDLRSRTAWPLHRPAPASGPAEQPPEGLAEALEAAVQDRFQGQARVACYLSGGIDSTTVTTLAARHAPAPLDVFTVDFGDSAECARAADTARRLGLRHHVLPLGPGELVEHFDDTVLHAETIGFNAIGSARWLLGRFLSRAGYKVVIVGDGSDELFAGYGFSVMDSLCLQSPARAQTARDMLMQGRQAFAAEMGSETPLFDLSAFESDGPCPYLVTSWNFQRSELRQLLQPDLLQEFARHNPYEMLLAEIGQADVHARRGLNRSMFLWQQSLFVNQILVAERLDMAHGIESRYPFLDERVAAIAARTPDQWLVHDLREKRLLRHAVQHLLPGEMVRAEKRPFAAPLLCAGEDAAFRSYLMDALHSRGLRESGIWDPDALRRLVQRLPSLSRKSRERVDSLLMMALSFLALQRRFQVTS